MEAQINKYQYLDEKGEHLHTFCGKPLFGTSTVVQVLNKDGLTWWAAGLAVQKFGAADGKLLTAIKNGKASEADRDALMQALAAKHEEIMTMSLDEYFALVDSAYRAHQASLKDSAQKGTDLHAELERFVKDCIREESAGAYPYAVLSNWDAGNAGQYDIRIRPFVEWTLREVRRFLWSEINCYSERLWIGGISDCGYEKHDGTIGIMDFKSSRKAYIGQFFQIAGYDLQICENGGFDANGNQTFAMPEGKTVSEYAILPFGMEKPEPQFHYDIAGARGCFLACLTIHKKMNVG